MQNMRTFGITSLLRTSGRHFRSYAYRQKTNRHGKERFPFGGTMYKLHNNPILYPHQVKILTLFFATPFAKQKDTGLSEFYFASVIADVDKFETLPKMKFAFNKKNFIAFYHNLSHK